MYSYESNIIIRSYSNLLSWDDTRMPNDVQDTRAALVEATILSLHRHGLDDTSVATITEIAGLSRGMIRHCFASKSALMVSAYDHLLARWTENFFAQRADTPLDSILLMIDQFFDPRNFSAPYLSAWLAFLESSLHDADLRQVTVREYETWRTALKTEIAAYADFTGQWMDAESLSNSILALSDGLWLRHALEPERITTQVAQTLCRQSTLSLLADASRRPST